MSLKDSVKKAAAATGAAGVAAATAGLSTCHSGGGTVVDPVPPPLVCSSVSGGQTLVSSARKAGDVVTVAIRATGVVSMWQVTRVGDVVGGTISGTTLPKSEGDSLVVTLQLATAATTQADFTVEGSITGYRNESCTFRRTFHVTVNGATVQVAETSLDRLPLRARERAEVVVVGREGRTVALEARTAYRGAHTAAWEVTGGELDTTTGHAARWTLPAKPGIYQAEVLLDYGADGVAFDALMLEVRDEG